MSHALAFVFPGQGSQRVGMLDALPPAPQTERLLDAAEALSGLPLRALAAEGPDASLADTRAAQPLLFVTDLAWASLLRDRGVEPALVAGHSLGELAALSFAGVFSPEAGVALVCERAKIMATAASAVPGGMAAVLGMDRPTVAAALEGVSGVWVANDNAPGQVVISGTHTGVESATRALTGAGARRVVPLAVAGPFHSPLMQEAQDRFAAVLAAADFRDAVVPVVQNTDPTPQRDAERLRERLSAQITAPVRWTETMEHLRADGVQTLVEVGPGGVLAGLAKRVEGLVGLSVESEGIERIVEVSAA